MGTAEWFPDELAHAGAEHFDAEYVEGYDRKAGTDPGDDVALLRELGLTAESTVIDLGAGTGTFAFAVAPLCGRVIAIDVSPAMLEVMQQKAERAGITNIKIVRGGFLSYLHEGEPADVVYSRNALHHLPDFWKVIALARIAAMLRPGGVLRLHDLVYSFDPAATDRVVERWLAGAAKRPEVGWTSEEFATHLREEYSTFSWLIEPMLARTGFDIRDVHHRPSQTYSAYTCIRR